MEIHVTDFGQMPDGTGVKLFTLKNGDGISASLTNYGATLTSLVVPDARGRREDIVAGFDSLDGYLKGHPYFGCIVGRVANRIGKARFTLDGKTWMLAKNERENHIHGGIRGFDKAVWDYELLATGVRFTYTSPHLEEGYPGELSCRVDYVLEDDNELVMKYHATTDRKTVVNLTNHSYFNLTGFRENIYAHGLMLNAKRYTELDDMQIPTGRILPVEGTFLDFTGSKPLGKHIDQSGVGYDHNFVINKKPGEPGLAAHVFEPISRRRMEVWTTQPGVQLYTGNYLDGTHTGKHGRAYGRHDAFCLETQHFPDSPNHPDFPSIVLDKGETYEEVSLLRFSFSE